jgi:phage/conjugal plasmid C-4 type zinc finger TraR family protein
MHDDTAIEAFKNLLEKQLNALHLEVQEELQAEDPDRYADVLDLLRDTGAREAGAVESADRLHELNLAAIARHVGEIRGVEAALGRIDNGHYGVCTHCGEEIPAARLQVQPAAARCVACQSELESRSAYQ